MGKVDAPMEAVVTSFPVRIAGMVDFAYSKKGFNIREVKFRKYEKLTW
jgi:hypothetical protein